MQYILYQNDTLTFLTMPQNFYFAHNLKPYNYFEFLLTEIPKHMEDTTLDFLDDLLPWSENLPDECKKQNNRVGAK